MVHYMGDESLLLFLWLAIDVFFPVGPGSWLVIVSFHIPRNL